MKKLPIGIQSFEKLRDDNYVYVDKTRFVYDLAHSGGSYFFLSRPRRFGKSLLLTTLKAYFEGKRHLFEGLAIMELEHDWKQHPVLHLDLNTGDYTSVEGLWDMFRSHVIRWEKQFGVTPQDESIPTRFASIINSLDDVVILLDEYDKPLIETLDKPELNTAFRERMRSMYSVLKTCDAHIRFAMLTGVSRFKDLGIFSGLNNLEDITLDRSVATICGFTEDELHDNFGEYISLFAEQEGIGENELTARLKQRWHQECITCRVDLVAHGFAVIHIR